MSAPRIALAVGALLLLRAALTVVRGRRALAAAGETPDGFSPPWTAVLQAVLGCIICLFAVYRHLGGLLPIRQLSQEKMRWDALHERPGFRCMYTRMRCAAPLFRASAAARAQQQQQQQQQQTVNPREKKRQ